MAHLRQCTISLNSTTTPISIPESFGGSKSLQQSGSSLPVGASVAILKGLIETVLRSGGGLQRVRANLYAALMYFMQTAPETQETKEKGVVLILAQVLYSFICFVEAQRCPKVRSIFFAHRRASDITPVASNFYICGDNAA